MAETPSQDERLTTVLSDDGSLTAVAWRDDDLITMGFYENVVDRDSNEYYFTHLWEIRAFATPDDYPLAMPPEELTDRLSRWFLNDFPHLDGGYGSLPESWSERSLRRVPFHKMAQEAANAYFNSEGQTPLVLPTHAEMEACRQHGLPNWFRSIRDMDSAFDQLTAVSAYVEAVNAGATKPVVAAALTMFGDEEPTHVTRVRNLIQFARQNGYLSKAQHGRSGGVATRKALELVEAIKTQATAHEGDQA